MTDLYTEIRAWADETPTVDSPPYDDDCTSSFTIQPDGEDYTSPRKIWFTAKFATFRRLRSKANQFTSDPKGATNQEIVMTAMAMEYDLVRHRNTCYILPKQSDFK
jgi:hypothetical protein